MTGISVFALSTTFLSTFPRRERPGQIQEPYYIVYNFYPRSHVGNDLFFCFISFLSKNFYPRSHVGNDLQLSATLAIMRYFYPRSHVGNDRVEVSVGTVISNFYPRSHVGNDDTTVSRDVYRVKISIHVPT